MPIDDKLTPRDRRTAYSAGGVIYRDNGAGYDVALIATGVQTTRALEAAEALAADGISAYVLHLPTVKPLDEAAIVAAAKATGKVVTCEEPVVAGGLGGAVCEVLAEHHPGPVKRLGLQDVFAESGGDDELLEKYGLTARHVAEAARAWAKR